MEQEDELSVLHQPGQSLTTSRPMAAGAIGAVTAAVKKRRDARTQRRLALREGVKLKEVPVDTSFWPTLSRTLKQKEVRAAYLNPNVQWFIASLIMGNFFTNIIEKQIDPGPPDLQRYPDTWPLVELVWNSIFIVELVWNMWGCWYVKHWKGHFLSSGWNVFDMIVVAVSIPSMTGSNVSLRCLPLSHDAPWTLRVFLSHSPPRLP